MSTPEFLAISNFGVVDSVVAEGRLEETAQELANTLIQHYHRTLSGMKSLINFPIDDLKDYLVLPITRK